MGVSTLLHTELAWKNNARLANKEEATLTDLSTGTISLPVANISGGQTQSEGHAGETSELSAYQNNVAYNQLF